jgi:hypothetical protein
MEKNRIQINGVWYVREDQVLIDQVELDPTGFEGYVVENSQVCFEATRIKKDEDGYYDDIDVKCTIKKGDRKDWIEDHWDNNSWMLGILNNNPDSHKELPDMGGENILFLQAFLQFLKDKEWL